MLARQRYPLNRWAQWPSDLRRPDFIGVGAPKSATTWLYAQLASHHEIVFPDKKELNYFSNNHRRPVRWYAEAFPLQGFTGEISPNYCVLPDSRLRWMRHLLPDARLVFMVRHPLDRAWSHVRMVAARGGGSQLSDADANAMLRDERVVRRSDYDMILLRLTRHYPRSQIGTFAYEEVQQRPEELLRRVQLFLGLSPDVGNDDTKVPVLETSLKQQAPRLDRRTREVYTDIWQRAKVALGDVIDWPSPVPESWDAC